MRLFVTGASGFIGSHFVDLALSQGHTIVALSRDNSMPKTSDGNLQFFHGELHTVRKEVLEKCDALYHFASHGVSPQRCTWASALEINTTRSIALIQLALEANVPRIVCCGSCMEYGKAGETYEKVPPDAPLLPFGPYAISKVAFAHALASLSRTTTSKLQLLRPFHVYGDGQYESNFWPTLKKAAIEGKDFEMTSGEQIRDYQSVVEVVSDFLEALYCKLSIVGKLNVRNLGSGEAIKMSNFAEKWWRHWEASGALNIGALAYRENEVMRYVPCINSIAQI
ncbi:MAG: NAD-dependent epimerase/dehydratase family protein [Akkermansiaceae bacterium]